LRTEKGGVWQALPYKIRITEGCFEGKEGILCQKNRVQGFKDASVSIDRASLPIPDHHKRCQ
jgi:hypothetical protein